MEMDGRQEDSPDILSTSKEQEGDPDNDKKQARVGKRTLSEVNDFPL